MARLPRPTLHWLLWLVIALLPLRGWAQAQMAAQGSPAAEWRLAEPAAARMQADPTPAHCHEAAAAETAASAQADTGAAAAAVSKGDHSSHPGCSLCGVCHASVGLAAPGFELHLPALPEAAPTAAPLSGLADGPSTELFRPPRRRA